MLFKKDEPKIKKNPNYVLNFTGQGDNHAILKRNNGEYKDQIDFVSPRRQYTCYPATTDNNEERKKQLEIISNPKTITVKKGFWFTIAAGEWDKYRNIDILLPSTESDLPKPFRQGKLAVFSLIVMAERLELEIIELYEKDRIAALKLLNEAPNLLTQKSQEIVTSIVEKLPDFKQKNKENKVEDTK